MRFVSNSWKYATEDNDSVENWGGNEHECIIVKWYYEFDALDAKKQKGIVFEDSKYVTLPLLLRSADRAPRRYIIVSENARKYKTNYDSNNRTISTHYIFVKQFRQFQFTPYNWFTHSWVKSQRRKWDDKTSREYLRIVTLIYDLMESNYTMRGLNE